MESNYDDPESILQKRRALDRFMLRMMGAGILSATLLICLLSAFYYFKPTDAKCVYEALFVRANAREAKRQDTEIFNVIPACVEAGWNKPGEKWSS
jgi:hypothetical protein